MYIIEWLLLNTVVGSEAIVLIKSKKSATAFVERGNNQNKIRKIKMVSFVKIVVNVMEKKKDCQGHSL